MIRGLVRTTLRSAGLELRRLSTIEPQAAAPPEPDQKLDNLRDQPQWVRQIVGAVAPYTMTSPERIAAVCQAVDHLERFHIAGDIVECGVWRGGSTMAAALTLAQHNSLSRTLYLFDTFEGMPPPTAHDTEHGTGRSAADILATKEEIFVAKATLDGVQRNLAITKYPSDRIVFIPGKVEDTIPLRAPTTIALLRLDTDWYESTKHELVELWPRLVSRGILIIDDYGHWSGARKAVDEYFDGMPVFLHRIDYTGRLIIKP